MTIDQGRRRDATAFADLTTAAPIISGMEVILPLKLLPVRRLKSVRNSMVAKRKLERPSFFKSLKNYTVFYEA